MYMFLSIKTTSWEYGLFIARIYSEKQIKNDKSDNGL